MTGGGSGGASIFRDYPLLIFRTCLDSEGRSDDPLEDDRAIGHLYRCVYSTRLFVLYITTVFLQRLRPHLFHFLRQ